MMGWIFAELQRKKERGEWQKIFPRDPGDPERISRCIESGQWGLDKSGETGWILSKCRPGIFLAAGAGADPDFSEA